MTILDLAFYSEKNLDSPEKILEKHKGSSGHFPLMAKEYTVHVHKFCDFNSQVTKEGVNYHFSTKPPLLSLRTFLKKLLKQTAPDVLICHSFIYPIENWVLKSLLSSGQKLIVQHHAEEPATNFFKRQIQKIVFPMADAYLFTSKEQAEPFLEAGIIGNARISENSRFRVSGLRFKVSMGSGKVYEVMEGSTYLENKKERTLSDPPVFLYVSRLIKKKDPFTVISAFAEWKKSGGKFVLKMVYGDNELEASVKKQIEHEDLKNEVQLLGKIEYHKMQGVYDQADYFVAASHYEGSGWALCEAMACGCVPVVSDIPSFKKIYGEAGYLFPPGDKTKLFGILKSLNAKDFIFRSAKAKEQFEKELSFEAIAEKTAGVLRTLRD